MNNENNLLILLDPCLKVCCQRCYPGVQHIVPSDPHAQKAGNSREIIRLYWKSGDTKLDINTFLTVQQLWLSSAISFWSPFPMYKTELLGIMIGSNESLEICIDVVV